MASSKTLFFVCLLVAAMTLPKAQATIPIVLPPITLPPIIPITLPPIIPITLPPIIPAPPVTIPPVIPTPPVTPVIPTPPVTIPPVIPAPPVTIPPVIPSPPVTLPPLIPVPPVTLPPIIPTPPGTLPLPTITGVIRILGIVFCTVNGTANPGSGLLTPRFPNATVQLLCGQANTTVASVTTNSLGQFSILLDSSSFNVSQIVAGCRIVVTTPLASCNATLSPTGILTSLLRSAGTTFIGLLVPVSNVVPVGFTAATNVSV